MENKENTIEFLENGGVVINGTKAIETWINATAGLEGRHKPHPKLNKEENELVTKLLYFPEDKNVAINLKIKNKKDKVLAIALRDHWKGAMSHSNIERANKARAIFKKLFKDVPENLF